MKENIIIRLERENEYHEVENLVRESFWYETAFGMCIAQVVWSIMYSISFATIRHLFQNWILS